jgi:hypothetical protein
LDFPTDLDVYWNTSMMFNWMKIMLPQLTMLKIRMPYGDDQNAHVDIPDFVKVDFKKSKPEIDFEKNFRQNKFCFPKAKIFMQAWAGKTSSELRFHIAKKDIFNIIKYNVSAIEGKMFYFNMIERFWATHPNKFADKKISFCHCNDCALESKIWQDHIKQFPGKKVLDLVKLADRFTSRPLSHVHKINNFGITADNLCELIKKSQRAANIELKNQISKNRKYSKRQPGNKGRKSK